MKCLSVVAVNSGKEHVSQPIIWNSIFQTVVFEYNNT